MERTKTKAVDDLLNDPNFRQEILDKIVENENVMGALAVRVKDELTAEDGNGLDFDAEHDLSDGEARQ